MLLASASRPFAATMIFERNRIAVRTKSAAGRACSATPSGRVMVASELASITRILRSSSDLVERRPRRGHDRSRDRTLDERGVDEPEMTIAIPAEDFTDGEDRASEVAEQHDTLTLVSACHGLTDEGFRGPEATVRSAAGGLDVHIRTSHLTGQQLQSRRQLGAV